MKQPNVFRIEDTPVHLGLGAKAIVQKEYTGSMEWYQEYARTTAADGDEGRLVALHTFSKPWDSWEMHPRGDEIVICLEGRLVLHQELTEGIASTTLEAGQGIINPAGVWHTADADAPTRVLFITAGAGTEHRPR